MSDEVKNVNDDELDNPNDSPEQKASKIDKQYGEQMKFLSVVLGSETAINPPKVLEGDAVAVLVARMFKEREEKLATEVFDGLNALVEQHLKDEAAIKEDENKLKQKRTSQRKAFIKVVKAWRNKLNQPAIAKQEYAETLRRAIEESKEDDTHMN